MRTDYKNPLNLSNLWLKKTLWLCDFASNFSLADLADFIDFFDLL